MNKIDPLYNQSSCLPVLILDRMSYSHSLLKHLLVKNEVNIPVF